MSRWFHLELPDRLTADRQMTKGTYKKLMHYLRFITRMMHNTIDWNKMGKHMSETMIHGSSVINYEDFLL